MSQDLPCKGGCLLLQNFGIGSQSKIRPVGSKSGNFEKSEFIEWGIPPPPSPIVNRVKQISPTAESSLLTPFLSALSTNNQSIQLYLNEHLISKTLAKQVQNG